MFATRACAISLFFLRNSVKEKDGTKRVRMVMTKSVRVEVMPSAPMRTSSALANTKKPTLAAPKNKGDAGLFFIYKFSLLAFSLFYLNADLICFANRSISANIIDQRI